MKLLSKIKLVIFDLDGTLVDAYPAIIESFNFTMQKLGYPKKEGSVIRKAVGWGDENLLKPFVKEEDLLKALSIYRKHHKESLLRKSKVFSGVFKVLDFLKRKKIKVAIASNRPTKFSLILIRHLGLDRYVDYVLCADEIKHIKPNPYLLNKIMRYFEVLPSETLYVGDMTIDVEAGNSAEIKTIIVTTGSSSKKEIKRYKPFKIIKKITDLLKIIPI
jgi:phosphoglycolate phosphatase